MSVSLKWVSKIRGHFETLWAVKMLIFRGKIFVLLWSQAQKRWAKSQKKGPLRFLKNFFKIFCKFQPAKLQSPASWQAVVLAPSPPFFLSPYPLSVFKDLPERLSFLAWNGIVTLWTSTSAKGGVYGAAVYFFLADDDLQQREWIFCSSVMGQKV